MTRRASWRANAARWLFLAPAAVLLVTFTHYPTLATLVQSVFSSRTATRPPRFVGLDNYAALLGDDVFWKVVRNNVWFAFGTIPTSIAIAILMALWVNRRILGVGSCAWPTSRRRYCR